MSKRATLRQIPDLIAKRQPFTGNSMSAFVPAGRDRDGDNVARMGRLYDHPHEQEKFRGQTLDYVILSYSTPIAAITSKGRVIKVEAKFSVTTTHHQNTAATGLRMGGFQAMGACILTEADILAGRDEDCTMHDHEGEV